MILFKGDKKRQRQSTQNFGVVFNFKDKYFLAVGCQQLTISV